MSLADRVGEGIAADPATHVDYVCHGCGRPTRNPPQVPTMACEDCLEKAMADCDRARDELLR